MSKHLCRALILVVGLVAIADAGSPLAHRAYVEYRPNPGWFPLVQAERAATIVVDAQEWPGVTRAARNLQRDILNVTGSQPSFATTATEGSDKLVIIGTAGRSPLLDGLARSGKLDLKPLSGKWESCFLQVVTDPLPGVNAALVIAGSDKRGTIYGIYDLCENIGISPWHFWADAAPHQHEQLFIKPGIHHSGEPAVKYRGIFINDEAPDLSNWVREKYGTVPGIANAANYNSDFYAHVFDLMLRLKANYLWPAMWNNAFNEDDPLNPKLADEMGIVMGTSHQEPMLRAQKEWDRRHRQRWNYYRDAQALRDFWKEGISRNKDFESIITIGLRGANDTEMIPGGTVEQSMTMLKEIVEVQRKMIADTINPDPSKIPQLWCPYKEVLEYYNRGFRVPDDVTLLWTDDNWGNLRRVPTADERHRAGGAGIYYHFDYVGGPRNYKWINTNPIPKVWEQMTFAREHGADRVWIVNVGHLRGLELPMEYFMRLAWEGPRWTNANIREFTRLWAMREFGPEYAEPIADILSRYTRYNGRRKPELLEPLTYSLVDYHEADRVVADFNQIADQAQAIYDQLPAKKRDAFYQIVLFPTKACAQVNELYVAAGKNSLYAEQGRASTNDYARRVEALFQADADLMDEYHKRNDGRWNHFMDQVHIGYTSWQDPPRNIMPRVRELTLPVEASIGIAVEGSVQTWPGADSPASLPTIDVFNRQRRYIDIFNRGQAPFDFTASATQPWITLSKTAGRVEKESRLLVGIDWSQAPPGNAAGELVISRDAQSVSVKVQAFNTIEPTPQTLKGFVEAEGVVSMEAEHFTRAITAGNVRWERIDDYGRTLSGMTPLPMTAAPVPDPRAGPCMEYSMYLFTPGDLTLHAIVGPSLNVLPTRGLRMAVAFDDAPPQVLTIVPHDYNAGNGNRSWEASVKDSVRMVTSTHRLSAPGYHTLKVWMVDPGVVLQKLVVDTGGLKPSYLGPPESFRRPPD
jgi:hypothetical protein